MPRFETGRIPVSSGMPLLQMDPTSARLQKNEPFALRLVPGKNQSTVVPDDLLSPHPAFDLIRECFA